MTRIEWDTLGKHYYEMGVARGVLYPPGGGPGVPWNGLISVTESPSEGTAKPYYLDGVKYLNRSTPEEFEATIEAFTYPDEFAYCDGTATLAPGLFISNQYRQPFGLSYRTRLGDDQVGIDRGYKIHLIYNALAAPTEVANATMSESPEPVHFSWSITTTPVAVDGFRHSAHFVIDSTKTDPMVLAELEDQLYGSADNAPNLPTIAQLLTIFNGVVTPDVIVIDNGDGTFTMTAPDTALTVPGDGTWTLNSPAIVDNGDGTFTVTST